MSRCINLDPVSCTTNIAQMILVFTQAYRLVGRLLTSPDCLSCTEAAGRPAQAGHYLLRQEGTGGAQEQRVFGRWGSGLGA